MLVLTCLVNAAASQRKKRVPVRTNQMDPTDIMLKKIVAISFVSPRLGGTPHSPADHQSINDTLSVGLSRRKFWAVRREAMGIYNQLSCCAVILSLSLAGAVTQIMKITVGRPRPGKLDAQFERLSGS